MDSLATRLEQYKLKQAHSDLRRIRRGSELHEFAQNAETVDPVPLDQGDRSTGTKPEGFPEDEPEKVKRYKKRSPTNSERMNRSLAELGPSAFKIHTLIWKWRGAPARGFLPFFTIHSLAKFCNLTRPTVRTGLAELKKKGWLSPGRYNAHFKNTLYKLVPIRKVPRPGYGPEKS